MPRLAANLTLMFNEQPFLERFDAAADAGFAGVECLVPYELSAASVRSVLERRGLALVLFNFPVGDWNAGDRGFAANPKRRDEFRGGVDRALAFARITGCKKLHLMPGKMDANADRSAWRATFIENVRYAADAVATEGIDVLLEPINTRIDIPGYFYDRTAEAVAVMDDVDRSNVKLQYDIYHMQIMEGDIARTIERYLPRIGHLQLADNPGRHEPGTGEINYPWLLAKLDALAYDGWVGCEYKPAQGTVAGLKWAEPYLKRYMA